MRYERIQGVNLIHYADLLYYAQIVVVQYTDLMYYSALHCFYNHDLYPITNQIANVLTWKNYCQVPILQVRVRLFILRLGLATRDLGADVSVRANCKHHRH